MYLKRRICGKYRENTLVDLNNEILVCLMVLINKDYFSLSAMQY
jgi:hypothetical protein